MLTQTTTSDVRQFNRYHNGVDVLIGNAHDPELVRIEVYRINSGVAPDWSGKIKTGREAE